MESYTTRFDKNNLTVKPRNPDEELVVVTGSLRNAKQSGAVAPSQGINNPGNTALAGADGCSFPPIAYDSPSGTNTGGGFTLLPGAAMNFAVVFSVPKGTEVPRSRPWCCGWASTAIPAARMCGWACRRVK